MRRVCVGWGGEVGGGGWWGDLNIHFCCFGNSQRQVYFGPAGKQSVSITLPFAARPQRLRASQFCCNRVD